MDADVADELLRDTATQVADQSLKHEFMTRLVAEKVVRELHGSIYDRLLQAVTMLGIEVDHRKMATSTGKGTIRDYEMQFVIAAVTDAAEKHKKQRSSNEGVLLSGGWLATQHP